MNAVTSVISNQLEIFLRPGNDANGNPVVDLANGGVNSRNEGFLFHEALHGFTGAVDEDLKDALGIPQNSPSSAISAYISSNCF